MITSVAPTLVAQLAKLTVIRADGNYEGSGADMSTITTWPAPGGNP